MKLGLVCDIMCKSKWYNLINKLKLPKGLLKAILSQKELWFSHLLNKIFQKRGKTVLLVGVFTHVCHVHTLLWGVTVSRCVWTCAWEGET